MAIYNNRICKDCGVTFSGGPRAWYCIDCREKRKAEQKRRDNYKHTRGLTRKLGSTDICEICKQPYIVSNGLQRFCKKCGEEHLKEIDNAQGTEYYHKRVDKAKRNELRRKNRENKRIAAKKI